MQTKQKRAKKIQVVQPEPASEPEVQLTPPTNTPEQIETTPIQVILSEHLSADLALAPQKPVRKRATAVKKTVKPVLEQEVCSSIPVNLLEQFNAAADPEPVLVEPQPIVEDAQDQAMDVDADVSQSVASELEHIINPIQRKNAYIARATLKRDILAQAQAILDPHLEEFEGKQKQRVSELVLRLYDDPVSLFQAVKHANKGSLKMKFRNLPRASFIGDQKQQTKKLEGFRQFLHTRISQK